MTEIDKSQDTKEIVTTVQAYPEEGVYQAASWLFLANEDPKSLVYLRLPVDQPARWGIRGQVIIEETLRDACHALALSLKPDTIIGKRTVDWPYVWKLAKNYRSNIVHE